MVSHRRAATCWRTRPVLRAASAPDRAVRVTAPSWKAVTLTPDTIAMMPGSDEVHSTVAPARAWPRASTTVATSPTVSSMALNRTESSTVRVTPRCSTRTAAVPARAASRAVISARPSRTAVTTPSEPTVAIEASLVDQEIPVAGNSPPSAFRTFAWRVAVSPIDTRLTVAGLTSIELGTEG